MTDGDQGSPQPPEALRPTWSRSGRPLARRIVQPLQAFLETETSSAVLLLGAAAIAMLWANAPLGDSYRRVWGTELSIGLGERTISNDVRWWVSDGLMTLFFFLVGLEIKRELLTGELRDRRRAALPVIAALGGMLVPAAIYLSFTAGTEAARGVGIVLPTDIVLALGVLALARGAPAGLRALLLALAIVDDLSSIGIVAFGYADGVAWLPFGISLGLFLSYWSLWRVGVRAVLVFVVLGLASWVALENAHIAPTIAGVVLAFLTPAMAFQRPAPVSEEAHRVADQTLDDPDPPDADAAEWLSLASLSREAVSPLARAEALLLPWSSYVVVPLFVLANAGVELSRGAVAEVATSRLGLGILTARVIGKPLGIMLACLLALRFGLATLPPGAGRRAFVALGAVAGIPFTVSLFVARIALPAPLIDPATVAIMLAALVAGLIGFLLLRRVGGRA